MGSMVTAGDPLQPPEAGRHSPSTRTVRGLQPFSSVMPSRPENVTRSPSLKRWPRPSSALTHVTIPGLP